MPQARSRQAALRRQRGTDIGRRLAQARVAAERTQAQAADALGLAQTAIAKLEAGARTLGFLEALELADLYGVSVLRFDPRADPDEGSPLES